MADKYQREIEGKAIEIFEIPKEVHGEDVLQQTWMQALKRPELCCGMIDVLLSARLQKI
jgi:hypothetical protein